MNKFFENFTEKTYIRFYELYLNNKNDFLFCLISINMIQLCYKNQACKDMSDAFTTTQMFDTQEALVN